MAQFLGRDIEQQILATGIIFPNGLGEVSAGGTEFSLKTTELLEQQIRKTRIRRRDAHGVLEAFVMNEHEIFPVIGRSNPVRVQMWDADVPVPVRSRIRPWIYPDSGATQWLSAPNGGLPALRADALAECAARLPRMATRCRSLFSMRRAHRAISVA